MSDFSPPAEEGPPFYFLSLCHAKATPLDTTTTETATLTSRRNTVTEAVSIGYNPSVLLALAIVAFLLNAAVVGAGIYLTAYLKKKAEHLATHEEFKNLRKQTEELTHMTKDIEAKISDEVWNRQRRWELKRDLLLETAKKISRANDVLTQVYATYHTQKQEGNANSASHELQRQESRVLVTDEWSSAAREFNATAAQVALVCSPELTKALWELATLMTRTFMNTTKDPGQYNEAMPEYLKRTNAIDKMIRKELGIDSTG